MGDVITVVGWAVAAAGMLFGGWVKLSQRSVVAAAVAAATSNTEKLDAAALRARTRAALVAGPEACGVLVRALDEEAARGMCATCAQLREELAVARLDAKEMRDARIEELRGGLERVIPALERSGMSQDAQTEAVRELIAALKEGS